MKLLCPLCGEETQVPDTEEAFACEKCGKRVRRVAYGKAFLLQEAGASLPGEEQALALVTKAEDEEDPVRKKKLLDEALALCPDSLAVNRELLHLGRLWQRNPRKPDFHIIKCYLLHALQEPEEETPQMREEMLRELMAGDDLQKCLRLASSPEEFMTQYLQRICREYIQIFLASSGQYGGRVFGFQMFNRARAMAPAVARMIRNADRLMPPDEAKQVQSALKEAFKQETLDEKGWLDKALQEVGE